MDNTIIIYCVNVCSNTVIVYDIFGPNETLNNVINGIIVLLFVGIIISDTSKLLVDSKIEMCPDHACINYPLKASSLALDVANIFVRLTDAR